MAGRERFAVKLRQDKKKVILESKRMKLATKVKAAVSSQLSASRYELTR